MPSHASISVVMAAYNIELFIDQAVESVLGQTFSDFELIVVEGGSRDATREILESYRDPRLRVVRHACGDDIWLWFVESLNLGLSLARGEMIARMDGDDVSLPHRFERQMEVFAHDPELVLLGTDMNYITESGKIGHRAHVGGVSITDHKVASLNLPVIPHGSAMFKKSAVERAGTYRKDFRSCEDQDMWYRLAEVGRVGKIHEPHYLYRINRGSIIASGGDRNDLYGRIIRAYAEQRRTRGDDPLDRREPTPTVPKATRRWLAWRAVQRNSIVARIEGRWCAGFAQAVFAVLLRPMCRRSYGNIVEVVRGYV
jgi:glycosyltransferase involved in cell wall biosynthesis